MAGKSPLRELTDLQLRFCLEYAKDLDRIRAVYRAGYKVKDDKSAATIARENLSKLEIQQYLGEIAGISEAKIVSEIISIALSQITDVLAWDGEEITVTDTKKWSARARASVKSFTYTKTEFQGKITTNVSVVMHDKLSALEKLMKKLRIYPKDIPVIDAVTLLLNEGVATPDQARIVTEGIARIQSDLKGEISDRSPKE